MEKTKFFVAAGLSAALIGTAVVGGLMLSSQANTANYTASAEEVQAMSADSDWQDGGMVDGAFWTVVSQPGNTVFQGYCPECGEADNTDDNDEGGQYDYSRTEFTKVEGEDCTYTYVHWHYMATRTHEGTVKIHNGVAVEAVPATCTTAGSTAGILCQDCGATTVKSVPATDHTYDSGVAVAANELYCADTKYTCTTCETSYYFASTGTSARKAHETTVLSERPSTCLTAGSRILACTVCEYSWTETLPLAEHTYPEEGIVTTEATCETDGVMTFACTICGGGQYTEPVPAFGHDIVSIPAIAPTCTEAGHGTGSECATCGKVIVEPIEHAALGHVWGEWEDSRTSCDEVGIRTRTCSRCEEVETEDVPAGSHTWNLGEITQQPTCTQSGVKELTCILCGDTQTEVVPATGHQGVGIAAVSPTCTQTGLTAGSKCTLCGIILEPQQIVPAKGHDLDRVAAVDPTTSSEGNIEYWHCTECGMYFSDRNGTNEIDYEDTILERLPEDDVPVDDPAAVNEGGMSWWQITLAVIAGVVLLGVIAVLVEKFVLKKKE